MQAYERSVMLRGHLQSLVDAQLATGQPDRAREPRLPLTGPDYQVHAWGSYRLGHIDCMGQNRKCSACHANCAF